MTRTDVIGETEEIEFAIARKKNSTRGNDYWLTLYKKLMVEARIETNFGQLTGLFPKSTAAAVTFDGFLLKVMLVIMAFALNKPFFL